MFREFSLYIDGGWTPGSSGRTRQVLDPATEEVIATIADATAEDLDRALAAAARGFKLWRAVGPWERAAKIRRIADLMRGRADAIAEIMSVETGKPLAEAKGETLAAAEQFDWYAEETKRIYGYTIEARQPDIRMQVVYQPVGVVAAFCAWNFPALLPSRKMAAALGAGCSIIVKPASEAPGTCAAIVECCHDAGIPAGVVNWVTGNSSFISKHLIASPIVRKVTLTGSTPVGKELLHMAAEGVKRVSMELGGHAPVLVFADADIEQAAQACATVKYRNCGQVCISPSRFFVHESVYERFSGQFAAHARSLKIGRGLDAATQVGPMANARGVDNARRLVDDAVAKGAELLAGGDRPAGFNRGFFFAPTVLGRVSDAAAIMTEEPFAPVAPIATFRDFDEVIARANALPFGLAGYVFTRDIKTAAVAAEALEVGMCGVNDLLLAAAEIPFGGVKESGMGREGGALGLKDYLETKYIKTRL